MAAILLMAIGGSAWWGARTHSGVLKQIRNEQVRSTGELLARSAEAMLINNDLSAVRRMVIQTAREANLGDCQIVMHDGRVIAHVEPTRISPGKLPPSDWPAGPEQNEGTSIRDEMIHQTHNLVVPGRGTARLHVTASQGMDLPHTWHEWSGTVLIAIVTFIGLLWIYRRTRDRVRLGGEIREVLRAIQAGEQALEAMQISNVFGKEADTWNRLLSESQKVRQKVSAEQAHQKLGADRRSTGGLTSAVDMMSQGLLLIDAKTQITYVN
ncbi:MAG: hypothetical protein QGH33_13055, partial [Pirellulaceae bacterium]|nr:hypothetical protein [Pirellulaceae bacterium]